MPRTWNAASSRRLRGQADRGCPEYAAGFSRSGGCRAAQHPGPEAVQQFLDARPTADLISRMSHGTLSACVGRSAAGVGVLDQAAARLGAWGWFSWRQGAKGRPLQVRISFGIWLRSIRLLASPVGFRGPIGGDGSPSAGPRRARVDLFRTKWMAWGRRIISRRHVGPDSGVGSTPNPHVETPLFRQHERALRPCSRIPGCGDAAPALALHREWVSESPARWTPLPWIPPNGAVSKKEPRPRSLGSFCWGRKHRFSAPAPSTATGSENTYGGAMSESL